MPKLDMIALPDFEAGAMENFGCITYRETDLLLDPKHRRRLPIANASPPSSPTRWHTSGSATWSPCSGGTTSGSTRASPPGCPRTSRLPSGIPSGTSPKTSPRASTAPSTSTPLRHYPHHPRPRRNSQLGDQRALRRHRLRKGRSCPRHGRALPRRRDLPPGRPQLPRRASLRERNRRRFLERPDSDITPAGRSDHAKLYRPAWRSPAECEIERACRLPHGTEPVLPKPRHEHLQHRPAQWTIPVCLKAAGHPICSLLQPGAVLLPVPADAPTPFLFANADAKGYYRTAYSAPALSVITGRAETALTAPERIGLLGDQWALTRAGQGSVADFLNLVLALKSDPNGPVLETAVEQVGQIAGTIAAPADRPRLAAALQGQFAPVYTSLGPAKKSDSIDTQQRRALLFDLLGGAKDAAIVSEANRIADRVYPASGKPDTSIDPALAQAAVEIAAAHATDSSLYDRVLAVSGDDSDPNRQSESLAVLSHFTAPALVNRTLELGASGKVRKQDVWRLFAGALANRDTRTRRGPGCRATGTRCSRNSRLSTGRVSSAPPAFSVRPSVNMRSLPFSRRTR